MEDVVDDETCNTRLCLGLSMGGIEKKKKQQKKEEEEFIKKNLKMMMMRSSIMEESGGDDSDIDQIKNKSRKKLRLSKEQSDMLEDSFKLHTSLNPVQKHELALQLNLKPRQVEVWFQNRRARKKLKQTEEECEILKKCCETLKDENQRLKKEVEELRSMKLKVLEASSSSSSSSILCNIIQLSNLTTLAMCSSCHKPIISTNNNNIGDDDHISEFVVPQIAE